MTVSRFLIVWLFVPLPMVAFSECLDFRKNMDEIGKCCLIEDWIPERDEENCTNRHKFQFTERRVELVMCVHACYYRYLGVVDEFQVDLPRIQQLNSNRSQDEQDTINKAALTCYEDKYEEIIEELMRWRTECNSYPYLYHECIKNELRFYCHERLWRNSTVCDQFRARDFC